MWTELDQKEDRQSRSFVAYRIERAYMRLADQTAKVLNDSCGLTLRPMVGDLRYDGRKPRYVERN